MIGISALALFGVGGILLKAALPAGKGKKRRGTIPSYLISSEPGTNVPAPATSDSWTQSFQTKSRAGLSKLQALLPRSESNRQHGFASEAETNQLFALSLGTLAVFGVSAVAFAPISLIGLPVLLYITIPVWRGAFESLIHERKIGFYVLYGAAQLALIVTGHFLIAALDHALFYLAEKLVNRTQDQAKESLISAFFDQPRTVWVRHEGVEIEIPLQDLKPGDVVLVSAGQTIPIDGHILQGIAAIDQRILTGEARPVEREAGGEVFAGTTVLEGKIAIRVEKTGGETVAAQIGELLNRTTDYKANVQLKGEAFADKSALPLLSLGVFALPLVGYQSAVSILFSGIGDTARVTAPMSVLRFLRTTSQGGILVKDGRALELLSDVDTFVFDKTGTLTLEQPIVSRIHPCQAIAADEILRLTAGAEAKQSHPIAQAILTAARERQIELPGESAIRYEVGYGVTAQIDGRAVKVGSRRLMEMSHVAIPATIEALQESCDAAGHSLVYVAVDGSLAGVIELHATLRPEAESVIQALKQRGLDIYLISGDQEIPTRRFAHSLGIEHYFAQVLPEKKAELVAELQTEDKSVCFVGDGINDAIALKSANVSISLRGASALATDTAGIILMDGSLRKLSWLLDIAQDLNNNMRRNFIISLVPGVIVISGAFFLHWGVLTSIGLYNLGLLAGMTNAMLPQVTPPVESANESTASDSYPES